MPQASQQDRTPSAMGQADEGGISLEAGDVVFTGAPTKLAVSVWSCPLLPLKYI